MVLLFGRFLNVFVNTLICLTRLYIYIYIYISSIWLLKVLLFVLVFIHMPYGATIRSAHPRCESWPVCIYLWRLCVVQPSALMQHLAAGTMVGMGRCLASTHIPKWPPKAVQYFVSGTTGDGGAVANSAVRSDAIRDERASHRHTQGSTGCNPSAQAQREHIRKNGGFEAVVLPCCLILVVCVCVCFVFVSFLWVVCVGLLCCCCLCVCVCVLFVWCLCVVVVWYGEMWCGVLWCVVCVFVLWFRFCDS